MRARILFLTLTPLLGAFAVFGIAGLPHQQLGFPARRFVHREYRRRLRRVLFRDHGLSAQRGYRHTPLFTPWAKGVCPDAAAPLLKPVIGKTADEILLSTAGITVNGKLLPHTAPLAHDSAGRPLTHWPFGRYRSSLGTLWVRVVMTAAIWDPFRKPACAPGCGPC